LDLLIDQFDTPIGEMTLMVDREGHLRALDWTDHETRLRQLLRLQYGDGYHAEPTDTPPDASGALKRYFDGDLTAIDTIPVRTAGTDFQRQVWHALRTIPCGTTVSYGQLATRIGRPDAVRAVGAANGANPISVVVPCHRVIGANGALTGYGGGIRRKSWLLAHENMASLQRVNMDIAAISSSGAPLHV
jgi:methylated-DNA-[protein]-cysteine S-methyltransferase